MIVDQDARELFGSGFLQKVVASAGSRAALLGLSVVTAVIVTRALGPDGRGLYATAVALSAIGVQLGNLGLHASNTWAVSRDQSSLGSLIANSLMVSAVVGGLIATAILLLTWVVPGVAPLPFDLLLMTLVSILIGLAYLLLQQLLLGTDRIRAYNALEIAVRATATVLLVGLVFVGLISAFSAFTLAVVFVLWHRGCRCGRPPRARARPQTYA